MLLSCMLFAWPTSLPVCIECIVFHRTTMTSRAPTRDTHSGHLVVIEAVYASQLVTMVGRWGTRRFPKVNTATY